MSARGRLAAVLLVVASAPALGADKALTLEAAVRAALENNPELKVAEAEVGAAQARLRGASVLLQQNPELAGRVGPRTRDVSSSLDYELELSQPIELGGQRGARIDAAEAALAATRERLRERRINLTAEVSTAYARAAAAEELLALAMDAAKLAERSLETAQQRFDAGDASRIDVNAAKVEFGRTRRDVRGAEQLKAEALSAIGRLVAASPADVLRISEPLAKVVGTHTPPPDLDDAVTRHPSVVAERRAVEEARAELGLANRELVPTPRVGVAYSREEDAQIVQGTLSFELPVFNQNLAARGLGAARITQAERVLEAAARSVRSGVQLALSRRARAQAVAGDFDKDILAAARENLELINEAYAAGKIDFLQLLLVRRDTLETQRAYIEALEELAASDAGLGAALGREVVAP